MGCLGGRCRVNHCISDIEKSFISTSYSLLGHCGGHDRLLARLMPEFSKLRLRNIDQLDHSYQLLETTLWYLSIQVLYGLYFV